MNDYKIAAAAMPLEWSSLHLHKWHLPRYLGDSVRFLAAVPNMNGPFILLPKDKDETSHTLIVLPCCHLQDVTTDLAV